MPCHSYRTNYEEQQVRGECDCGWVSNRFRTPLELHAAWSEHSSPPRRRRSSLGR